MRQRRPLQVLVVDGCHVAYRSFWKLATLQNSEGQLSGAFYGAIKTLRWLLVQFNPDLMFVVFDGVPVAQKKILESYKGQRDPKKDAFRAQVKDLRQLLPALGIYAVHDPRSEADPIVAALAGYFGQLIGAHVEIVSSDSDYYQCLRGTKIVQYDAIRRRTIVEQEVLNRYGLKKIEYFVLMKAIIGDKSDNIPPVKKGVGPKTAAKIVNSSVVYRKFLRAHSRTLTRNIDLVLLPTMYSHLPDWLLEQLKEPRVRLKKVKRFFKKYELYSFLKDLEAWNEPFYRAARKARRVSHFRKYSSHAA